MNKDRGKAALITSSPYHQQLQKKCQISSTSDESDEENQLTNSSDSDLIDDADCLDFIWKTHMGKNRLGVVNAVTGHMKNHSSVLFLPKGINDILL